jgi:hypothetical protein
MQFNYLGGQSNRDTLQNALGQRSSTLEGQLDFSKNAFTTGVQGVGNTLRSLIAAEQQNKESVLRNKTTIQEGILNLAEKKLNLTGDLHLRVKESVRLPSKGRLRQMPQSGRENSRPRPHMKENWKESGRVHWLKA